MSSSFTEDTLVLAGAAGAAISTVLALGVMGSPLVGYFAGGATVIATD